MKKALLALATIASLAFSIPLATQTASAQSTVVRTTVGPQGVVRRTVVKRRPPVVRRYVAPRPRCVTVVKSVRGPRGVVRRISERRCS